MAARVRTPTILQMEAAECGAVSLAIVLAHHGRNVPLEALRGEAGVSRDGSSAFGIIEAAQHYGLEAEGYRVETSDLGEVALPAILHWQLNHFVVLEGLGPRGAFLNDPATGPRRVGMRELDECFSGVVIELVPGADFQRGGTRPGVFSLAGHWLAGARHTLLFFLLVGVLLALPRLAIPAFGQIMVDHVLVGRMGSWLAPLALGMVATGLLLGALTWLEYFHLLRFEQRLAIRGAARLFHHLLRLPTNFYLQRSAGDLGARLAVSDEIAGFLAHELSAVGLNLLMLVLFAGVMVFYDPAMTAVVVAFAGLDIAVLLAGSGRLRSTKLKYLQGVGQLVGRTANTFHTIESVKASGTEEGAFAAYAARHAAVVNEDQRLTTLGTLLLVAPTVLHGLCLGVVLLLGGLAVMDARMTQGMLVAFLGLTTSFLGPVTGLVRLGTRLQEMNAAAQRVDDILAHPADARYDPEVSDTPPGGRPAEDRLSGALALHDVTFGYARRGSPAVESFSFELAPGRATALVGASGSGKSTIGRLAAGLYRPWAGEVHVGGRPLSTLPPALLGGSVAYVDQEISLFEDTVRANLTLWDPNVSQEVLEAACDAACVLQPILERPGGWEHRLTEGGGNFSGGERQRLEIARALAAEPSLLILDEATSALDPATEQRVFENLRGRGLTLLVIAHRLSTVRDCDEILVLDAGRIVARGTHDELLAGCETYRGLAFEG